MTRLFLKYMLKNNEKKSKHWGIISNCAVILQVLSSFMIVKTSKSFSSCAAVKNWNWNCYTYNSKSNFKE